MTFDSHEKPIYSTVPTPESNMHLAPISAEQYRPHPPREPLRSLRELADEFGLSNWRSLASAMSHSRVPAPAPKLVHRSSGAQHNSWYSPSEMRRWWKAHNQAKTQPKELA